VTPTSVTSTPVTPTTGTPTQVQAPTPTPLATPASRALGLVDGSTGQSRVITMDAADAGGPSYLDAQYIYAGSDGVAIATASPNVFLRSGSGNDALLVTSGYNVLDGGTGSNYLTGGTGTGADTFFTDARGAGAVWNTIVNFHAGDAATLWGFTAGVSSYWWEQGPQGAAGAQGATLRANIVGGAGRTGDGIDASITFAGLSVQQAKGLMVATGQQPAGSYLYLYNPGV
jgi:serralysin